MKHDALLLRLALAECRAAGAPADRADVAAALVAAKLKVVERRGQAVVQVLDNAGNPRIANAHGDDLDLSAWVSEVAKARPMFFRPDPEAPSTGTKPEKTTTPSTAEAVQQKREQDASDDRAEAAQRLSWANPWIKGQENLTHQMVLLNREPDRAARFKAAAGARD